MKSSHLYDFVFGKLQAAWPPTVTRTIVTRTTDTFPGRHAWRIAPVAHVPDSPWRALMKTRLTSTVRFGVPLAVARARAKPAPTPTTSARTATAHRPTPARIRAWLSHYAFAAACHTATMLGEGE